MLSAGAPPTPTKPAAQIAPGKLLLRPKLEIDTTTATLAQTRDSIRTGTSASTTLSSPKNRKAQSTPLTPTPRSASENWERGRTPRHTPITARRTGFLHFLKQLVGLKTEETSSTSRQPNRPTRTTSAPSKFTGQYGQNASPYSPTLSPRSVRNRDDKENPRSPSLEDAPRSPLPIRASIRSVSDASRSGIGALNTRRSASAILPSTKDTQHMLNPPPYSPSSSPSTAKYGYSEDTKRTTPLLRENDHTPTTEASRSLPPSPSTENLSFNEQSRDLAKQPSFTSGNAYENPPPYSRNPPQNQGDQWYQGHQGHQGHQWHQRNQWHQWHQPHPTHRPTPAKLFSDNANRFVNTVVSRARQANYDIQRDRQMGRNPASAIKYHTRGAFTEFEDQMRKFVDDAKHLSDMRRQGQYHPYRY